MGDPEETLRIKRLLGFVGGPELKQLVSHTLTECAKLDRSSQTTASANGIQCSILWRVSSRDDD
jgi:hypothetical protein